MGVSGQFPEDSEAPSHELPTDPDLAALIDAWPTLPRAVKAGIVAMVKAAGGVTT